MSWRRRAQRLLQMIRYRARVNCARPHFLIAGAQKGGTTSLYAYLSQHPNVLPPVRKEVHFFEHPPSRARGERWYRSHFPSQRTLDRASRRLGSKALTCEATPHMHDVHSPRLVHSLLPDCKLIFLLRDPAQRTFSHYQHIRRANPQLETLSFGEAIRAEAERIGADLAKSAGDEDHDDLHYRIFCYVRGSLYAYHLERWLAYYPRESVFIESSETFFSDPQRVLRSITDFLGLPPHDFDVSGRLNVGGYDEEIASEDLKFLEEAFAADKARLERLVGRRFWT